MKKLPCSRDLSETKRYWVTTQWPHRVDTDPDTRRDRVYLSDGSEKAGADLRPGDLVAVYEAKNGRKLIRKDISGHPADIKRHRGRQGIVALLRVTSKFCKNGDSKPEHYTDGTEMWWRWYADAESYSTSGFVQREQLNIVFDYAPGYLWRVKSGLRKIDKKTFDKLVMAFNAKGSLPELKPVLEKQKFIRWGTGEEGPLHKMIKEAVAADPAKVLGEAGLRTIQKEFPFPTGDRADVLLEDAAGKVIGLEVEPAVGDNDLPGILQSIKYRYMGALMRNKRFSDSRAFLVAGSISKLARKICKAYDVECFVVDPSKLTARN